MDRKNIGIVILSLTAALLLAANAFVGTPSAQAEMAVADNEYQMITARATGGGDALYIVDKRTGQMAVFAWDAAARNIVPKAVRPLSDAFARGN